jgi:hypothetical protein
MNTILASVCLECHVSLLLDYGIESLEDLELAVKMTPDDCAEVLESTGISPFEWVTLRRALLTTSGVKDHLWRMRALLWTFIKPATETDGTYRKILFFFPA